MPRADAGLRFDRALARALPQYSRALLKSWIESGAVQVDGRAPRPRDKVQGGEEVRIEAQLATQTAVRPEAIPLAVIHEDRALIIINKPAGLVVHPGAGNARHTLQNALLALDPKLARVPRAGLVHRLDKDTSGLLVVARTPEAHAALVAALVAREIGRQYLAVCTGAMTAGGTVDEPIGRHRIHRTRMAVRADGRRAVTRYRIVQRFRAHTLVRVELETGRTHQIRVHLAHIGFPIVGDPVYGGRRRIPAGCAPELAAALRAFPRQALGKIGHERAAKGSLSRSSGARLAGAEGRAHCIHTAQRRGKRATLRLAEYRRTRRGRQRGGDGEPAARARAPKAPLGAALARASARHRCSRSRCGALRGVRCRTDRRCRDRQRRWARVRHAGGGLHAGTLRLARRLRSRCSARRLARARRRSVGGHRGAARRRAGEAHRVARSCDRPATLRGGRGGARGLPEARRRGGRRISRQRAGPLAMRSRHARPTAPRRAWSHLGIRRRLVHVRRCGALFLLPPRRAVRAHGGAHLAWLRRGLRALASVLRSP
ncbi:MAG: RluA family pseudouridine synthase [Gammaproteobacteria bacterium]|nr:MAG: RluA family pseudouridine synthase [Gammaproteobacteria bacterium]